MKKTGYKHTQLGWVPEEWDVCNIGSLIKKLASGVSVNGEDYPAGPNEYGVLKVSSVSYGFFNEEENKAILKKEISRARQNPLSGAVIVSRANTPELVGASAYIYKTKPNLFLSDKLWQIEIKNEIADSLWLSYLLSLKQVRDILRDRATGTSLSMRNISQEAFFSIEIILPPLSEQQRIATILSTWDQAIAKQQQLIEALKIRHRALMQQLLTGKKRLKGFKGEWKKVSYGSLLTEVKRHVVWNDGELYSLISVKRRSGGIFYREALFGHQIKVKDLRIAKDGDFLFSKMQIVHGASALVTREFDNAKISGSYIAVVASDPKKLDIEYFNWHSQLPYFYHQTYVSSFGVHIEKMTFDFESFLSLEMRLSSLAEQSAIAKILGTSEKGIQIHRRRLAALQEQKKGLMQVLLTGKVRVKV